MAPMRATVVFPCCLALAGSGCGSDIEVLDPAANATAASVTSAGVGGATAGTASSASSASSGGGGGGGADGPPCSRFAEGGAGGAATSGAGGGPGGCFDPPGTEILADDPAVADFFTKLATDVDYVYATHTGGTVYR